MLIVGYCFGIRSERRLCEEVHLNLAYRWFCRLGIEDAVPEHSTFSKNRHGRFRESDTFRHVFETVLERCMSEGLVGGEGFAIDASVVKADAARASAIPGVDMDSRALGPGRRVARCASILRASTPRAAPRRSARVSRSPIRRPSGRAPREDPAFFAYSTNYLVDVRVGVIVDVEATSAHRTKEVQATRTMIDRVERRFSIKPSRLIGDMAYGSAELLAWMVNDKAIEPHVPLWDSAHSLPQHLFICAIFSNHFPHHRKPPYPCGTRPPQFRVSQCTGISRISLLFQAVTTPDADSLPPPLEICKDLTCN